MKDEKTNDIIYRKLYYFYSNKIPVHFKDHHDIFYNGLLLDLNLQNATIVIAERKRGDMPLCFDEIRAETIYAFKEVSK